LSSLLESLIFFSITISSASCSSASRLRVLRTGSRGRFSKPYRRDYQVGEVKSPTVSLATAVAASSAFPPVLSPAKLELDPAQVDMLLGDTDLCPWDLPTGGSLTMWQTAPVIRGAAAEARAVLLGMASRALGAPVSDLALKDGAIWVKAAPQRRTTFGELVKGRKMERHLGKVKPKPLAECTVIGRSVPRKDALAKITGAAKYAGDLRLPGTLHACSCVSQSPIPRSVTRSRRPPSGRWRRKWWPRKATAPAA